MNLPEEEPVIAQPYLAADVRSTSWAEARRLHRVADAYVSKYGWPVTVRDGAFYGDGAPTAGRPPYVVYEVIPTKAFGFPTEEETLSPTRWGF
jgi:hypothetical protein